MSPKTLRRIAFVLGGVAVGVLVGWAVFLGAQP